MTNEKAIKCLKKSLCYEIDVCKDGFCKDDCAIETAIEALEKQIPKKPLIRYENMGFGSPNETFKIYGCPCCKEELDETTSFCQNCGQKIDWSEEGEKNG